MSMAEKRAAQEMPAIAPGQDVDMDDQDAKPLEVVYVCERDSKSVLVYKLAQDSHERRPIQMDSNFLANFQYC